VEITGLARVTSLCGSPGIVGRRDVAPRSRCACSEKMTRVRDKGQMTRCETTVVMAGQGFSREDFGWFSVVPGQRLTVCPLQVLRTPARCSGRGC
jgi:hypothetical protein